MATDINGIEQVSGGSSGPGTAVDITTPLGSQLSAASVSIVPASDSNISKETGGKLESIDNKLPALSGGRIPVELPAGGSGLTDAELRASAVPVSVASLPLPAGAATQATLASILTSLANILLNMATEGNQGSELTKLNTIIADLDLLVANGSKETKQDTEITRLTEIRDKLASAIDFDGNPSPNGLIIIGGDDKEIFSALTTAVFTSNDPGVFDKALIVRNIPSGTQPVSSATLAQEATLSTLTEKADVLLSESDAGYVNGQTAKKLTQTPQGFLRSLAAALVSDVPQGYLPNDVKPLSLNTEGRLRVVTTEANTYLEFFKDPKNIFFDTPNLTEVLGLSTVENHPFGI